MAATEDSRVIIDAMAASPDFKGEITGVEPPAPIKVLVIEDDDEPLPPSCEELNQGMDCRVGCQDKFDCICLEGYYQLTGVQCIPVRSWNVLKRFCALQKSFEFGLQHM